MADNPRPAQFDPAYADFVRKMELFEDGPTTTNFEQLEDMGLVLPAPHHLSDSEVTAKLWEVLDGLARLRTYIAQTDHLSDRELYTHLWNEPLREEVPAIDEVGFRHHIDLLCRGGEPETSIHLRYFADDEWRQDWIKEWPDYDLPPAEDPPFNRDWRLPVPDGYPPAEARRWLRRNQHRRALAPNRFATTDDAAHFVAQLYAAGAVRVDVHSIRPPRLEDRGPCADGLDVTLPEDPARRHELLTLINDVGRPDVADEDSLAGDEGPVIDTGQKWMRLWWD
jgi:hypothetical protein